jgi:hypothetical protein
MNEQPDKEPPNEQVQAASAGGSKTTIFGAVFGAAAAVPT